MKKYVLTKREIEILKNNLLKITFSSIGDKNKNNIGMQDKKSILWKNFSLNSYIGMQVYDSFTDEELLYYLKFIAENLGYSPSQKEIFWAFRNYIKKRFLKWPYALSKANLPKSAGKGSGINNKK